MFRFHGGVHPPENKFFTSAESIVFASLPEKVTIHLQQHIGAPAEAVVSVGDEVKVGQLIGRPAGFVSSSVHASISGRVKAISHVHHPIGRSGLAVIIEGDGKDDWMETAVSSKLPKRDRVKEILQESGIVGLGGATFPTHVKVSPPKEKKIDTYILNGAECEPYLTADHRLMVERPGDIVKGLLLLLHLMELRNGIIGVEENKPDAIVALNGVLRGKNLGDFKIDVVPLRVRYPQGAEKQLIYTLLGREVPSAKLPMDVGVIVNNVGTAVSVKEAVFDGKPMVERVVTVSGRGVVEPKNLVARIGSSFSDLIEECGGFKGEVKKVLMGGPMMGISQHSMDVATVKGTSGILLLTDEDLKESRQSQKDCIRCGRCLDVCPMSLMPNMLGLYAMRFMLDEALEYHPMDCIECGSCHYGCPAKIPLVQLIRYLKQRNIARMKRKNA